MIFDREKYSRTAAPSDRDNLTVYLKCINDQETTRFMGAEKFPLTIEDLKEYIIRCNSDRSKLVLGILFEKSSTHIRNITVKGIDYINRNAEVGILTGNKISCGKRHTT